jgi:hypothetical protein
MHPKRGQIILPRMSEIPTDTVVRRAVRHLMAGIDRALTAAREIEQARAALDRAANRQPRLRVVPAEEREDNLAKP